MEKKALNWLIAKLNNRKSFDVTNVWLLVVSWSLLVVAITSLLLLAEKELISDLLLVLLSVGLGVMGGMFFLFRESEKSWPFILPHLSKESIETRIKEIET